MAVLGGLSHTLFPRASFDGKDFSGSGGRGLDCILSHGGGDDLWLGIRLLPDDAGDRVGHDGRHGVGLLSSLKPAGDRAITIGWACWVVPLMVTEVVLQLRRMGKSVSSR